MIRDFDQSTLHDSSSVLSAAQNKDHYRRNKLSGVYKQFDPFTGDLIEEGEFQYGLEVGLWKVIDQDGDQQHFRYRQQRVGARCRDGSYSSATGGGACSWHGGVAEWLTQNKRYQVGGTGKYEPIESKVQKAKQKLKDQLNININKSDQQILVEVIDKLLKMNPNPQNKLKEDEQLMASKVASLKLQYENRIQQLQEIQRIIECQNEKLKKQKRKLQEKLSSQIKQSQQQKQKLYQDSIFHLKREYEQKLSHQQKQLSKLKQDLNESRISQKDVQKRIYSQMKKKHQKNKLNLSQKTETQNQQIKNKIKLIQEQLNLLNKTIEQKKVNRVSSDDSYGEEQSQNQQNEQNNVYVSISRTEKFYVEEKQQKISQNQHQQKRSQQNSNNNQNKPQKKIQSLNQSQQSSIPYIKHNQQPSINNDSLSYSKILNSKLFKDQQNRSDLSSFIDYKSMTKKTSENKIIVNKNTEKSTQSTNQYRFRADEQYSEEQQESNMVTLKTDSQNDQSSEEENVDIFKSIPFKPSEIKGKSREDSLFK